MTITVSVMYYESIPFIAGTLGDLVNLTVGNHDEVEPLNNILTLDGISFAAHNVTSTSAAFVLGEASAGTFQSHFRFDDLVGSIIKY